MTSLAETLFVKAHTALYQLSNGWIGHRLPGAPPMLLLHSIGAKSGQPRVHPLPYARDGKDYLVVASNGGADRNPAWVHNLRANPHVDVNLGPKRLAVTAHFVLPDDPDYSRLWRISDDNLDGRYSGYQKMTERPIPIVRLTP